MEKKEWAMWADLIRSDQMSAADVFEFLRERTEFAAWYLRRGCVGDDNDKTAKDFGDWPT